MRLDPSVEKYRRRTGSWRSNPGDMFGWFDIPIGSFRLGVMVCEGDANLMPWDHVSVSLTSRCPSWKEMCAIKDLFFGEDETVVQFHPKKSQYVNNHPNCLHLWRKIDEEHELPPTIAVGLTEQELENLAHL